MSVKKKDRNPSKLECLNQSRKLVLQILTLTRPWQTADDGTKIKSGILGYGQPYDAFGRDLFDASKKIHGRCYEAMKIYIKTDEDYQKRKQLLKNAIEYCDVILRLLDLCIFLYGANSEKKKKSFIYVAKLTKELKDILQKRISLDGVIISRIKS